MEKKNQIRVETTLGTLIAEDVTTDSYYKGIEITLEYNGVRSSCGVWMEVDQTLSPPVLKLHMYDTKHDEPVRSMCVSKVTLDKECAMMGGI